MSFLSLASSLSSVSVLSFLCIEEEEKKVSLYCLKCVRLHALYLPLHAGRCNLMSVWIWISKRKKTLSLVSSFSLHRTHVYLPVGRAFTYYPASHFLHHLPKIKQEIVSFFVHVCEVSYQFTPTVIGAYLGDSNCRTFSFFSLTFKMDLITSLSLYVMDISPG